MIRRLYLFDDRVARSWAPFSLTRPAGELLFGALLLRERIERALGLAAVGYLPTPGVQGFEEEGSPGVASPGDMPREEERILLSSRYLPPLSEGGGAAPTLRLPSEIPESGVRLTAGGGPIGWLLPAHLPIPGEEPLLDPGADATGKSPTQGSSGRPEVELLGGLLETPWQLMSRNAEQLQIDLPLLFAGGEGPDVRPLPALSGVHRIGEHPVSAAEGVTVDPSVVLDTRQGPIHLGARVHVGAFTNLRGPALIGRESTLMGGVFDAVSCGPVCRLRGEVEASVILGYSNKAHDGYLGHSVLGRWVNLGAFTTNSDLKNNYGNVRVGTGSEELDTGLMKVGVFLGDHVKTGIGTLLNAGTRVGAGTNLFGGELPGKWIPPFRWGTAGALRAYRLDAFLSTAERAMGRRNIPLTPGLKRFLSTAWHSVHSDGEGTEE